MILSLKNFNVENRKVLLREDFNVPVKNGKILDNTRIERSLETINYLAFKKAKIILISHLGRPDGHEKRSLSLKPVSKELSRLLKKEVLFSNSWDLRIVKKKVNSLSKGEILLLENLRFKKQEEDNSLDFAQNLAKLADFYVNDAFATSHRRHASITGIPLFLPSAIGFTFEKELKVLEKITKKPERPLVFILGGKKEGKIEDLEKLLKFADKVLVGGKLVTLDEFKDKCSTNKLLLAHLTPNLKDIDEDSIVTFETEIKKARTIIWAGPLGEFESPENRKGTRQVSKAIVSSKAFTVVGGGDTEAALTKFKLDGKIDYISSGGGAMLFYLENKTLPALEVLKKQ